MEDLTLEKRKEKLAIATPRSFGMATDNPIFLIEKQTVGMYPIDTDDDPETVEFGLMDLEPGTKLRAFACKQGATTTVLFCDGKDVRVPNRDIKLVYGQMGE